VTVPDARFVVLEQPRWFWGTRAVPAIHSRVCTRYPGVDMVDTQDGTFVPQSAHLKSRFETGIAPLMRSDMMKHIDWNIENFVWNERAGRLYYVDLKPSTLTSRFSVAHNLQSLRELLDIPGSEVRSEMRTVSEMKLSRRNFIGVMAAGLASLFIPNGFPWQPVRPHLACRQPELW